MKKSEIRLLIIELITIFCLSLNIFVKNILNEYMISLLLLIMFFLTVFFVGFEKNKYLKKKSLIGYVVFYVLAFLILLYGMGLFTGYVKSSYSLRFVNIVRNILPILLVVTTSELLRYNLCKKGENKKIIRILSIVIFTLVDINVIIHMYDLQNLPKLLELLTVIVLPSVFKNFLLSDFSYKYGYQVCLIYQIIMNCYVYIMPFFPNLGKYLESVLMILFPILIKIIINREFDEVKKIDYRIKNTIQKIFNILMTIIIIITIALYSNLFRFWIAVVGSGSMTPTINIGDMIVVDKSYQDRVDELKVGDILVFKVKKSIYTHRIVLIKEINDEYYITTKGDRIGNTVDNWVIKKEDIVGKVKFRIPYIGYPTVWLNELLEGYIDE